MSTPHDDIDSNDVSANDEQHPTHPTTTHSTPGAGRPRIVFNVGPDFAPGDARSELLLDAEVTTIGSGDASDLKLDGLLPQHAEIRHDERDEYVLYPFGPAELSSGPLDSAPDAGHILRDGSRIQFGEWSMFFSRDEFADHGRPFGGRQGGEGAHQQRQPDRD